MKILGLLALLLTWLLGWGEDIESLRASFTQTTHQQSEKIIYTGTLIAKNPNLAKWSYTAPMQKEIYLNAKEVIIYEPLLEQATYSQIAQKADFFSIITSAKLGSDGHYHATIGDTSYTLILKDNKPYQILYKDELDNTIEITLTQVELNPKLDSSLFTFTPTQGIDLIRQ